MKAFPDPLIIAALPLDDPRMIADASQQLWELQEPFVFISSKWGSIVVPKGYVTNFASVPKTFHNIIDDDDPCILQGSVVHDMLYTLKGSIPGCLLTRQQCDDVLCEAMRLCGASGWQIEAVKETLSLFGSSHWGDV